jgi:hypothetical protein
MKKKLCKIVFEKNSDDEQIKWKDIKHFNFEDDDIIDINYSSDMCSFLVMRKIEETKEEYKFRLKKEKEYSIFNEKKKLKMNNILKIVTIILLFTSCGYAPMDNTTPVIVKEIKPTNTPNMCNYYGKGNRYMVLAFIGNKFIYRDSCGKYKINDTIKFTK